jgi:hypothetical protein
MRWKPRIGKSQDVACCLFLKLLIVLPIRLEIPLTSGVRLVSRFLAVGALLFFYGALLVSAYANTNSGIDTPEGVITLPLAVQGVEGMSLVAQPGGSVYVGVGTASPAGNLDIENGANTAKLCLNGACTESLASGEPQIVEAAVGGSGNATATATCPVGTYVTGGGALCTNGGGGGSDAWVFESYPSSSTTWTARCDAKAPAAGGGFNSEPVAANAYAICR